MIVVLCIIKYQYYGSHGKKKQGKQLDDMWKLTVDRHLCDMLTVYISGFDARVQTRATIHNTLIVT